VKSIERLPYFTMQNNIPSRECRRVRSAHERATGGDGVKPFDYVAPASLDDVLRLLAEHGEDATLLAGGQSLMILLRQGLVAPELLIGLKRVRPLATIESRPDGLRLGSMVTYDAVTTSPAIAERLPVAARAAGSVGSVHIRNLGTVGGSLCHADPAGDIPTVLLTLDASFQTVRPDGGDARYPAGDFFRGLFETRLEPGELLAWIDVPGQPDDATFGYQRFSFRHGEYPMAVAACRLSWQDGRCTDPRVAVGGGGLHPHRLADLERALDGATAAEALEAAGTGEHYRSLRPIADVRGSETVAEAVGAGTDRARS
jgi:carbon-monoxide dehydrogenase medium subunit